MPGAELLALAPGMLELVAKDDFDLQEVAAGLTRPVPIPEDDGDRAIPFPDPPKNVELTEAARDALKLLPDVFGEVTMTERRALSAQELVLITTEAVTIEDALKVLAARKESIKETIRHHIDVTAERSGDAVPKKVKAHGRVQREATPRDQNAHYLLAAPKKPFEVAVHGFRKAWQQRFSSGGTKQDIRLLEMLLAQGKITREEMLGFTRAVRVLDPDNIRKMIKKNPARGLQILAAITKREEPSSSLYIAEK